MKLVSFLKPGADWHVGVLTEQGVADLGAAGLPTDMLQFVQLGDDGLAHARAAVDTVPCLALDAVTIGPPLPHLRRNMFCIGKNYRKHAVEFANSGFDATSAGAIPAAPIIFSKGENTLIADGDAIPAHRDPTATTDYEGELAVVIGKAGFAITRENAMDHVYGYTIVNDVTARELQKTHAQWLIGKNVDGFCPMGPALVTADAFSPSGQAELRTFVNGELRQKAYLSELIFDIPAIIETLSRTMALLPGDVIATGTPEGVGIGFAPPRYLSAGDTVRIEIDGLGALVNPVA